MQMGTETLQTYITCKEQIQLVPTNLWIPGQMSNGQMVAWISFPVIVWSRYDQSLLKYE